MATIQNIISTIFNSQNAANTIRDLTNVNKNITRLGQSSASAGRAFSSQAAGLGGLVAAYAGAAATTFALQQAFDALARSARASQTLEGLKSLATASGESSSILLANVREITKNQLTLTEAAQQINLSLSAGFNTDQIERLGSVALKASRALGRDLTDSYTRVVRGSAKLETELLDELGIYTRIDPAVRAYADANNRVVSSLTDFERRQAFVNAVITEGERKFKAINTTVPTTSEKIEAFGTRIIDIATKLGIFLAEIVAPLAEFLTNNLAGSFGTVGLAAGLMAATLQRVTQEALSRFQQRAAEMAVKVNQSILSATSGFSQLQSTAQTAIAGVTGANKGLINGSAQELKALKEVAQQRRLNTVELQKAQGILNQRVTRLNELRKAEIQQIANLRAQRTAAAAAGQSTTAFNDQLKSINNRLKTTNSLLTSTAAQLTAVNAAAAAGPARLAAFASGLVTIGALGAASVARLAVGFVGLGGFILSAVSIVSLLSAGIAKLIGKQEEFNAVTKNLGAAIAGVFNTDELQKYNNTFLSTTAEALTQAENANDTLKELDTFKIKSKIIGIDIVVEKTKEDLVKEVSSILTTVATESEKTFGQSLADSFTSAFSIIGGLIGTIIPGVGNLVGFAIGTAVGSVIGAVVDQLSSDLPTVTDQATKDLIAGVAQERLNLSREEAISLFDDENLSRAFQLLTDQVGATKDLSFAGRLAYETQVQLLLAQAKNINNARILNQLVSTTGLSAAEINKKFGFDTINEFITSVTTTQLSIPVTFRILDERAILEQVDSIATEIDSIMKLTQSSPVIAENLGLVDPGVTSQLIELNSAVAGYEAAISRAQMRMAELEGAFPDTYQQTEGYKNLAAEVAQYSQAVADLRARQDELASGSTALLGNITSISENFRNLGSLTVAASNSALLATNSLTDLQSSLQAGTATLETYAQAVDTIDKNIERFKAQSESARASLAAIEPVVQSFRSQLETLPEDSPIRTILENAIVAYESLYDTILTNEREIVNLIASRDAVLANGAGIKAQLQLSKQLRDSFGSVLTQNVDLLTIFTAQGDLIANNAAAEASRFEFLQGVIDSNNTALTRRRELQTAINNTDGVSAALAQQILSTSDETYETFLGTLSVQQRIVAEKFQSLALTSDELVAVQNVNDALTIQQNLFLNSLSSLTQITSEINSQNSALQQRIGILQAQNAVAAAQRNLESVQLKNSIAQNTAQLNIRSSQAELTQLQIQQNKASGGGVDAKKQSLELLKSEIELRQTLTNIEDEATKRRLEANLDAAQKTKEAFAEVTTSLDLAGALTGIGSILANQLELIELERQQAEEKYQNTMETLAIERQILEAELSAASGAKQASEDQIQKQLGILRLEQEQERQAVSNAIEELKARSSLLDEQKKLQVAEARAEAAKARADIAALRSQGEQNIAFLQDKARLDQQFLDNLAGLLTQLAQAADPSAAVITAGKLATDFTNASDTFSSAIAELETSTNQIYGTIDDAGNNIGGLIFDELEKSFEGSKAAIQTEIDALRERQATLKSVQELEFSNAEAQLRAQQGGGASRLAELEAQLNAIEAKEAEAGAERARIVGEASKKQAEAIRAFATDVLDTVGKFITAQKQARINSLLAEEEQLKEILTFQTEALTTAQSAASEALQEEISLREKLKDATESLIQSQTSYLESLGGEGSVKDASKQFIDTLLEQKQAIFDLQRATRSRIAADGRVASLESAQAQLTDSLAIKTAERIEAETSLEKTQEKLALVTKLVSGEIGNFIKSLGSLGSSLSGLSGGGSFGQVFSNLLGFQDALASFATVGNTFAKAAGQQVTAGNTQLAAANTLGNATAAITGTAVKSTTGAVSTGAGAAASGSAATVSAGTGLTFASVASSAIAGAGVGSLIGALTGDTSWASTIGGAVGSTLATVFAGSKFVTAVTGGIAKIATSAGFAGTASASIAAFATPLVFAAIGALIIGALFGKKKPKPQAVISGTVTGEGFDTTSVTSRDLSAANVSAIESIPQQVFAGFLSNFEAAGLRFKDSADVTIDFYRGEFRKIETTFSSGLSSTATNIGKSAQDAADELERQFFRGLGATSFEVDQFTPGRERIQQALKTFGEIQDLDQKTRERFIEGLTYAQEFDGIVRTFLATSVDINDIFNTINSAAQSFTENKLNEYLTELDRATEFFGASSNELKILQGAIRNNALSLVGLAEAADGSIVSTRDLATTLNAGAIAIRNIIAETTALRSTFVGLGNVLSGIDIDATIGQALRTRLNEFVGDFGDSINLAIDILREPAKIVLVDLEKFIVNGTERIRQATGVYNELLQAQAEGIALPTTFEEVKLGVKNAGIAIGNLFKGVFGQLFGKEILGPIQETQKAIDVLDFNELSIVNKSLVNITSATELLNLELKGFISTISDKAQLQAIIDGAEAIDDYAGAIARSAAESRLAEINEIERTQATQQFNKVSREFNNRLREITGSIGGLSIGGEGASFIDVLEAFGTSEIDASSREFKQYLDLINSGSNISSNFNSAIDFLNDRFNNGETDSLKFVASLELLQRVTLETIDSIGQLTEAYESTLQQIADAFSGARQDLLDSVSNLSDELISLIKNVSDKTQEILGIYDDAVNSVTETGNAIFDLRDAAKDAFTSAADAVSEFEKANKLSGRSSAQLRAELESVAAQIANVLGSQDFGLSSFFELSSLTSTQSSLQRELKRLGTTEKEYAELIKTRTQASEDLAFTESAITKLSSTLNDSRSTESKIIQDTKTAVEDYTTAQATLSEVTATLTQNNFNLAQARIDETSAVIRLNEALNSLNRDTIKLDQIVADILSSSDSTLRSAFIEGAISNLAGELGTLDETARSARIAEVTVKAATAFDSLVPLAIAINNLSNQDTVNSMNAVTEATNLTTDTFANLLGVFGVEPINLVSSFADQINRYADISSSIASVEGLRTQIDNLSANSSISAERVQTLVTDLVNLQTQISTLTGDTGVDSLRTVFTNLAQDLQTAWNENVILGLPDVINLKAISVAPDGGLNELKTIASNSNKYAFIKAVGQAGMQETQFRAEGGYISGPGTSTSDSIPAQLSNGEYVIKASTVRKLGVDILNNLNASGDLDETLASKGRYGDTVAAHINMAEAALLEQLGGSGTRNPVTGMLEFFGGASSGAQAYGGLFSEQEAAYVKKVQESLPNGSASFQDSLKANWMDTRKLGNTFINTVGDPIDILGKGGNDIMSTASYDAMQNQMLSSSIIMDSLGSARGLEGIESQTQGFGTDSYKAPKKKKWWQKLLAAVVAFAVGALTFGAGAPLAMAALATGATGLAISGSQAAKAGELQNKDLKTLFADVSAQDLGRGGYDIKNSSANKVLTNGNTILNGQTDLNSRYNNVLSKMLGSNVKSAEAAGIVSEYNKKNDKFFDFYMLGNPTIPNYRKANYYAKNNSTGGIVNALSTSANLLGTNTSGQRDSIPAMLEPGEFVLRKAAVERMGLDTAVRLNSTGNVDNEVNVEVNVINNSSPVTPTIQQTRRENGKIIVDVILEDIRNNGPIRQSIKGVK